MEDLVGRKIRGFKFSGEDGHIKYAPEMDRYVGKIGTVTGLISTKIVEVLFGEDGESFLYPLDLAQEHLIPEIFKGLKRGDKILVSDDDREYYERIFITYIEGAKCPFVCVARSDHKYYKVGKPFNINEWTFTKTIPIKVTKKQLREAFGSDDIEIID